MITAHKKNHGARIPLPIKKAIALESLSKKQTIVNISRRYDCSRNTVYEQQKIALAAANKAFESADDDVLFSLPGVLCRKGRNFPEHAYSPLPA